VVFFLVPVLPIEFINWKHQSGNELQIEKEKTMRSIMSALIVLSMTFAMVSIGEAGWFPCCKANTEASAPANARDADIAGHFPTGTPYPCIASPAYTHYTDAKNGPCSPPEKLRVVPDAMGSPGY
jgi:hypothetical protein